MVALADLAQITQGIQPVMRGDPLPMINLRDVGASPLPPLTQLERVAVQMTPRAERARVSDGEVLVAARGTQFRSALVPARTVGAIASANLLVVRLGNALLPEVLLAFLRSPAGEQQLRACATSSTGGFLLTPKTLGAVQVHLPPMPIQQKLAAFARASDAVLAASERVLELRRELHNSVVAAVLGGAS